MNQPFFSVITCTYNSQAYLEQCIASVRSQGFGDYEHIIVDAYSTDSTDKIISDYAKDDPKVRIVKAEPRGIANAMNTGIKEARGLVIQHLHSDDYYHSSESLQQVFSEFRDHPRKQLVIGLCSRNVDGNHQSGLLPAATFRRRSALLPFLIHVHCYIAHPSTFIKKAVFDRHGLFDESFRIAMDYEFWLRILGREAYRMINVELTTFRHHASAASADHSENLKEEDRARSLHTRGFRAFLARNVLARLVSIRESAN
jgi:glycosyltransferase involved in cell wall biosynthesis